MKIKLDSFVLEAFDYDKKEHLRMISKFDLDEEINKYLITSSDSFSELVDYYRLFDKKSIYNKLYLVKKENEIIGSLELDGESDNLYINYSILKEYRGQGYCTRLLKETSKYLLNEINQINLLINKHNIASKALALRVGYKELGYDGYGFYKYQLN